MPVVRRKLLREETRNDKQAIIDALYEFLEDTLDAAA
jgi:phenylpyruvate tautomerase PptA (4-oxalocrotonate tautomerase family)